MTADISTLQARISGRVQGVRYRAWTVGKAKELGLTGWVRNRRDGTVEAVFHGPAAQVDKMIEACHHGPALAKVESVETRLVTPENWPDFTFEATK